MGIPIRPVIVNFFMEPFEQLVLELACLKPKIWLGYINNTFVIWSHIEDDLQLFLQHVKSKNKKIQIKMEKENNDIFHFLTYWYQESGTDLVTTYT